MPGQLSVVASIVFTGKGDLLRAGSRNLNLPVNDHVSDALSYVDVNSLWTIGIDFPLRFTLSILTEPLGVTS